MSKLEEILAEIKKLPVEDRKRLIYLLRNQSSQKINTTQEEPDWLLEGILKELIDRGIWSTSFAHYEVPKTYVENTPAIRKVLLNKVGRNLSYPQKILLGRVIAQCLIYYLGPHAPISLKYMLNSTNHILAAVEYSFPGYMRGNLIGSLVPRESNAYNKRDNQAAG